MSREAIMPQGLQFVNLNQLVDLYDLEVWKAKFEKQIEFKSY